MQELDVDVDVDFRTRIQSFRLLSFELVANFVDQFKNHIITVIKSPTTLWVLPSHGAAIQAVLPGMSLAFQLQKPKM